MAAPVRSPATRKEGPMITVDHLTKRCGTVAAVDGLSFEVRQPDTGQVILSNSGGAGRRVWYR
jgi:ABC-type branched-subunit amino acid transport system ATPase component